MHLTAIRHQLEEITNTVFFCINFICYMKLMRLHVRSILQIIKDLLNPKDGNNLKVKYI